jgi:hypothetical protein
LVTCSRWSGRTGPDDLKITRDFYNFPHYSAFALTGRADKRYGRLVAQERPVFAPLSVSALPLPQAFKPGYGCGR